jgi:hypothetical protein
VIPSEAAHPHRFVGCIGHCKGSGISSCVPAVAPSRCRCASLLSGAPPQGRNPARTPCRCSRVRRRELVNVGLLGHGLLVCPPALDRGPSGLPPGTCGRGMGRRGGGEGRAREEERIPVIVAGWLDTSPDAPSLIHPPQETGVPKVIVSALEKEGREEETNFPPSIEARVRQLTPPS